MKPTTRQQTGKISEFIGLGSARITLRNICLSLAMGLTLVALSGCGGGGDGGGGSGGGSAKQVVIEPTETAESGTEQPVIDDWQVTTVLPELRLNIQVPADQITKEYTSGSAVLGDDSAWQSLHSLEIKGRGNSTWVAPKKPYHLKLASKQSLLGMPAGKHWILLANDYDSTLMRNALAFDTARRISSAWAPKYQMIELFINEKYQGVYQLTEQIRVGDERVDIKKCKANKAAEECGYLLEVDSREKQPIHWKTPRDVPFGIREPKDDEINSAKISYIQNYIADSENSIFSGHLSAPIPAYAQYINEASFVDWFLVNELFKNFDANFNKSVYFHKEAGNGKLNMGPVWDFDLSSGVNHLLNPEPTGWHVRNAAWYTQLFQHPQFEAAVQQRWRDLRADGKLDMEKFIDELAPKLAAAQKNNTHRWQGREVSNDADIAYMRNWFTTRVKWMDEQFHYSAAEAQATS